MFFSNDDMFYNNNVCCATGEMYQAFKKLIMIFKFI